LRPQPFEHSNLEASRRGISESLFQNEENGLLNDRRLRADGFIIRAQAAIRTDGFFVRAGFANSCALRAPTPFVLYGYTPSVQNKRGS
jgi:hypothetical protein